MSGIHYRYLFMPFFRKLLVLLPVFFHFTSYSESAWTVLPSVTCNEPNTVHIDDTCQTINARVENISLDDYDTRHNVAGITCELKARQAVNCCLNPDYENCQYQELEELPVPNGSGGTMNEFDAAIENLVVQSNRLERQAFLCKHFLKSCYRTCGKALDKNESDKALAATPEEVERYQMIEDNLLGVNRVCTDDLAMMAMCKDRQAESLLFDAQKTLGCSQAANGGEENQIICYEKGGSLFGLQQCSFSASGSNSFADLSVEEQRADIGEDNLHPYGNLTSEQSIGGASGVCSGTPVGDGSMVITASHCQRDGQPMNRVSATINGQTYESAMECNANPNHQGPGRHDTMLCRVENPLPVDTPIYIMTLDPNIPSGCFPEDYFLRCGQDAYYNLNGQRARVISYPFSQANSSGNMPAIYSEGTLRYDPSQGILLTDAFSDHGSSGAGYIVEIDGRTVLISNVSGGYYYSNVVMMPQIHWNEVVSMQRVLDPSRLSGAQDVFQAP